MTGDVEYVDDVAASFADLVVREAPGTLALSGGDTARRCYETLAGRSGVDWPSVTALFGDERMVAVDHPDSNERMAREELLDHVPVAVVHSMARSTADDYDALVRALGTIDLVHLGMGPDGHIASLFPGSPALDEADRLVLATGDDLHPHPRLTLTFPGIALARHAVVTIDGDEKLDAWRRVRSGDDALPAARVRAGRVTWLVARPLSS